MFVPNISPLQYGDAATMVSAFNQLSSGCTDFSGKLFLPGLVRPDVATFGVTGLTLGYNLPSPFGILFGSTRFSSAHGSQSFSDTQSGTVSFASLLPSSGAVTGYLAGSYIQIQQNPISIPGPPVGNPGYNPNYSPIVSNTTNTDSINFFATTAVPDNFTSFELARVNLTPGLGTLTPNYTYQKLSSLNSSKQLTTVNVSNTTYQIPASGYGYYYSFINSGVSAILPVAGVSGNLGTEYTILNCTAGLLLIQTQGEPFWYGSASGVIQSGLSITLTQQQTMSCRAGQTGWHLTGGSCNLGIAEGYASGVAVTALNQANTYASGVAVAALTQSETYASGVAVTALNQANTYASGVAVTALNQANTYASGVAVTAQNNAQTYAYGVAVTAQNQAEAFALGLYTGIGIYATPGNYTYVVPANITRVRVTTIGAGGGGGGSTNQNSSPSLIYGGGGGGGGCAAVAIITGLTPGQSLTVVVGSGGASGGGSGGSSGISGIVIVAGGGGGSSGSSSPAAGGNGGSVGSANLIVPYGTNQGFTAAGMPGQPSLMTVLNAAGVGKATPGGANGLGQVGWYFALTGGAGGGSYYINNYGNNGNAGVGGEGAPPFNVGGGGTAPGGGGGNGLVIIEW